MCVVGVYVDVGVVGVVAVVVVVVVVVVVRTTTARTSQALHRSTCARTVQRATCPHYSPRHAHAVWS